MSEIAKRLPKDVRLDMVTAGELLDFVQTEIHHREADDRSSGADPAVIAAARALADAITVAKIEQRARS